MAARCGGSCFQNGSGSGKDAGRALVGDFLFSFQPVLKLATAEVSDRKSAPRGRFEPSTVKFGNLKYVLAMVLYV